jgi:hypothetical protein
VSDRRIERRSRSPLLLVLCIAVSISACGGGTLSLAEYGEHVQALANDMRAKLDELDAQMATGEPKVADAQDVLSEAVAARTDFQDKMSELDPPDGFADLHEDFLDAHARIIVAQRAWAEAAQSATSLDELRESQPAQAYRSSLDEAVAICHDFQDRIDATADRASLADAPWIPGDMKQVVELVLGC